MDEFILVYTPTFGFNPFRVYSYGSPINTAISVAIDGLVFCGIESAHRVCASLNSMMYDLEYLPEVDEVYEVVYDKIWDFAEVLQEGCIFQPYQDWINGREYAEAMEDAYPCPFEDWGCRE